MRLGTCKTGLSLPIGDISVVVLIVLCFGVEFLCCLNLMCPFIFKSSSGYRVVTYWEIAAHSAYMFS